MTALVRSAIEFLRLFVMRRECEPTICSYCHAIEKVAFSPVYARNLDANNSSSGQGPFRSILDGKQIPCGSTLPYLFAGKLWLIAWLSFASIRITCGRIQASPTQKNC